MAKNYMVRILAIMLCIVLLLTSCSDDTANNHSDSSGDKFQKKNELSTMILVQESSMVSYPGESEKSTNMYEQYIDTTEDQLREKGFDINIDIVPWSTSGNNKETYKKYVKSKLDSNFSYDIFDTSYSDILYEEKKIYYGQDIKIDRIEDYEKLLKRRKISI